MKKMANEQAPFVTLRIGDDNKAFIEFSEELQFADNFHDVINGARFSKKRFLDLHVISLEAERVDENLADWKVVKVDTWWIEIELTFKDPLLISSGFEPDILIVDVNLFEFKDLMKQL